MGFIRYIHSRITSISSIKLFILVVSLFFLPVVFVALMDIVAVAHIPDVLILYDGKTPLLIECLLLPIIRSILFHLCIIGGLQKVEWSRDMYAFQWIVSTMSYAMSFNFYGNVFIAMCCIYWGALLAYAYIVYCSKNVSPFWAVVSIQSVFLLMLEAIAIGLTRSGLASY